MAYTGNNQTSVALTIEKALAGMLSDSGEHDIVTRTLTSAGDVDAGRVVINASATTCEAPDADADVIDHFAGLTVYNPMVEPNTTAARFAAGDQVSVLRSGRGFAAVKTGTPVKDDPVYVYVGATTADRGMVAPSAAAGYVQLRGARFTGVLEGSSYAEIQFGDAAALPFATIKSIQIATGTLVAGEATISSGIKVTANTYVVALPTANITGSVNFGSLSNTRASNVVGDIGTGSVLIRALGSDGAKDADAAGAFVAILIN